MLLLLFPLILLGFTALWREHLTNVFAHFLIHYCLFLRLSALLLFPLSVPLQLGVTYCLAHVDLIMEEHDVVLEEEDLSLNDWTSIVFVLGLDPVVVLELLPFPGVRHVLPLPSEVVVAQTFLLELETTEPHHFRPTRKVKVL